MTRQEYRICDAENGKTVEYVLRHRGGMTKRQIGRLKFLENGILLNGEKVRVTEAVNAGDTLSIELITAYHTLEDRDPARTALLQESEQWAALKLVCPQVLYLDRDILVWDKMPGEVVHPTHGHYADTIIYRLKQKLNAHGMNSFLCPVGRLDRDTAGVLIFARNQLTAAALQRQRKQGDLQKIYYAQVCGHPKETKGEISVPIREKPGDLMKMECDPEGKPALTEYRVLQPRKESSLLEVRIITGRTHQIRVHMAYIGHPLVGDPLYGSAITGDPYASRLLAKRVRFRQPFTGQEVVIEGTVPPGFFI